MTQKKPDAARADRYAEGRTVFLALLLVAISMGLALAVSIVNRFIFPFSDELLSPLISQILILLIPSYLFLMILFPNRSERSRMKSIGFGKIGAEYVFLIIFTALFLISTALMTDLFLGGCYDSANGFTLLGTFTAGADEYTSTYPYIAIIYAVAPAFIEELFLRGILYTEFSKRDEFFAIFLTSVISAAFSFSVIGLPAALLCALTYCFVRKVTGSLFSCVIIHLAFNLYSVFLRTNVAKYFLSSQNNFLLITISVAAWLVCATLFFSEAARVFRAKSERIRSGEICGSIPAMSFKALGSTLKSVFSYRPNAVCAIISAVFFVAITAMGYFA